MTHFEIRLLIFLLLSFKSSLYIFRVIGPLADVSFANIYSQSVDCLLILFNTVLYRVGFFFYREWVLDVCQILFLHLLI